jgi:hypothetical protein
VKIEISRDFFVEKIRNYHDSLLRITSGVILTKVGKNVDYTHFFFRYRDLKILLKILRLLITSFLTFNLDSPHSRT